MAIEKKSSLDSLSDWLKLQLDFQARLMDETFRYLRRLQGAVAPVTPGTVLLPERGTDLNATTEPGGEFEIALEVQNQQRVHAVAAPALDPLVSSTGTTWYPEAIFTPSFALVAPDESLKVLVRISVPALLPAGTYVGALSLRGFRKNAFRLSVEVRSTNAAASSPRKARNAKQRKARKP